MVALCPPFELQFDTSPPPLDARLGRGPPPQVRIQVEVDDQLLQPRATQNRLANGVQSWLELAGNGRSNKSLRHLFLAYEHRSRGPVEARQSHHKADGRRKRRCE